MDQYMKSAAMQNNNMLRDSIKSLIIRRYISRDKERTTYLSVVTSKHAFNDTVVLNLML
jgi:hypothetical protein